MLGIYGLISIGTAAIFAGFEGASYNIFQDPAVFLGIASGVLLHELRRRVDLRADAGAWRMAAAFAAVPLLLAQPIWAKAPRALDRLAHPGHLLAADRRAESEFAAEAHYLAQRPGPAICESLLLCDLAGKPFILDPFNSRQYILAGRLDQHQLIRRIATHEFSVVQLRENICDDPKTAYCHILHYPQKFNRFTDEFLYAVHRYYRQGWHSRDGVFYVPR